MIDKLYSDYIDGEELNCRSYYGTNYSGLEDDATFNDYEEMEDWVWDKLQDGLGVEVNGIRFNPDLLVYGDEAYGIEDYLDEGISNKNSKKVNEDYATNTNDIDGMVDAVLDFVYTYDYWDAADSGSLDEDSNFTEETIEETRSMIENRDESFADYLEGIIDTLDPGEAYDGKIDDIIDYIRYGSEGEEKLRAMSKKDESVERVNTSDFDKMCLKEVFPKVKELVNGIQKDLGSDGYDTDDINGIVSTVASKVFECVTDELAKYFNGNKTNESLDEAYKGIDLNDYRNIIYAALETLQDANISLGSMTDKDVATILRKLRHDEYAQRINKDVDDWSDEDFESEYDYELGKREKEIDDLYDEYGRPRNESLDEDNYEADDDFTDGEAKTDENMNESLVGVKKLPVKTFDRKPSEQAQVPQTTELEDEVADESFAHDDSM